MNCPFGLGNFNGYSNRHCRCPECFLAAQVFRASRKEYNRQYHFYYQRRRRQDPNERAKDVKSMQRYYAKHRAEIIHKANIRRQARYKTDALYRLKENMRTRVRLAIKNEIKSGRTFDLVGCSANELRSHLERLFKPGMSWENYGLWHVDHVLPCESFNLSHPEQQKACFHYSNLQPLWASENLSKGAKILHYLDR